ncbi:bifunctional adenosylcobinamide kinase/adenosylcobinamide-phosphate guanylyltransferase [Alphaproteobacteria bacterium LSUCC0684]
MPLRSRKIMLALGGARSGKTAYAEGEALALAGESRPFYLATGQAFDAEMEARISRHRELRQDRFTTIEEPLDIASILRGQDEGSVILVDSIGVWITNLMLGESDRPAAFDAFITALEETKASVVIVSEETGLGIVPENKMARDFRDDTGLLNQRVAAMADKVVLMVAGLPMILK